MWRVEADPRLRSTMTVVYLLDCAPDWDRLVAAHDWASRLIPRVRQRVVEPPLGLGTPTWVADDEFDLGFHVRRVRLPEPGTMRQLLDLVQGDAMASFDRSRPPWRASLVEGLEDGRTAYVLKLHHSITDGQGGTQLLGLLHSRHARALARQAPARDRRRRSTPRRSSVPPSRRPAACGSAPGGALAGPPPGLAGSASRLASAPVEGGDGAARFGAPCSASSPRRRRSRPRCSRSAAGPGASTRSTCLAPPTSKRPARRRRLAQRRLHRRPCWAAFAATTSTSAVRSRSCRWRCRSACARGPSDGRQPLRRARVSPRRSASRTRRAHPPRPRVRADRARRAGARRVRAARPGPQPPADGRWSRAATAPRPPSSTSRRATSRAALRRLHRGRAHRADAPVRAAPGLRRDGHAALLRRHVLHRPEHRPGRGHRARRVRATACRRGWTRCSRSARPDGNGRAASAGRRRLSTL